jgi:hypothetical protein
VSRVSKKGNDQADWRRGNQIRNAGRRRNGVKREKKKNKRGEERSNAEREERREKRMVCVGEEKKK